MATPPLSFDRARFAGDPPPPDTCAYCGRGLTGSYYRVAGHLACDTCAQRAESLVPPDTHGAYTRALLFGLVGAVLGCIGYALFVIFTHILFGYAGIGVGLLVGWCMKKGSGGLGGRRYQITAVLLTYAAIAVAFVPIALHSMHKASRTHTAQQRSAGDDAATAQADADGSASATPAQKTIRVGSYLRGIMILLGYGLISPFLQLANSFGNGLFNLLILFIGMRFAWQFVASKRALVDGPFTTPGAPAL